MPAKIGRPSKIQQTVVSVDPQTGAETEILISEAIVRALRAGAYLEDAAEAAGVAKSTVYSWLSRGEEHVDGERIPKAEQPFVDFLLAVEKARAQAVVFNLAMIRRAATGGTWQAAAWWLERTRPQQYGRRVGVEHSGGVAYRPAPVDLSKLTDEEAEELEALLAKAQDSTDEAASP